MRNRVLSFDEEDRLQNVSPEWLREIITFALQTGCREGEILALKWNDVDLFRKVISVIQSKTEQPKSIPMTAELFTLLKSKIKYLKCDLIFPSENGTEITKSNLGRAFRKALKRAKIENFRFHDLRHTFASRLAQEGVDLSLIQRLLGHKEPRMVQRYAHHSIESLRKGIDVLNGIGPGSEKAACELAQI